MAKAATAKSVSGDFSGFPKATFTFLKGLEKNNNQEWFEDHRKQYMEHYIAPAQAFVNEMGPRLAKLSKGIGFDPDYNGKGSIKKIFTDRRFNPDRLPYKSWLDLMFWEGPLKAKKDNSAFYLRLTGKEMFLVAGIKGFTPAVMKEYRRAVADPKLGAKLATAIGKATAAGGIELMGEELKQVPRGFDSDYKHASLLKHNGLYVVHGEKVPAVAHSADLLDYAFEKFKAMAPVHKWLVGMLDQASL